MNVFLWISYLIAIVLFISIIVMVSKDIVKHIIIVINYMTNDDFKLRQSYNNIHRELYRESLSAIFGYLFLFMLFFMIIGITTS